MRKSEGGTRGAFGLRAAAPPRASPPDTGRANGHRDLPAPRDTATLGTWCLSLRASAVILAARLAPAALAPSLNTCESSSYTSPFPPRAATRRAGRPAFHLTYTFGVCLKRKKLVIGGSMTIR